MASLLLTQSSLFGLIFARTEFAFWSHSSKKSPKYCRRFCERMSSGVAVVVFVFEDFDIVSRERCFGGMAPLVDKFKI